jgi:hypothetical protein
VSSSSFTVTWTPVEDAMYQVALVEPLSMRHPYNITWSTGTVQYVYSEPWQATFSNLQAGRTYQVVVMSISTWHGSFYANESAMLQVRTAPSPAGAPAAPSDLQVRPKDDLSGIELRWLDNSNDETGFTIARSGGGTAYFYPSANQISYTDTTAQPGVSYTYWVLARNAYGNSSWSNSANTTIVLPTVSIEADIAGAVDGIGDPGQFKVTRQDGSLAARFPLEVHYEPSGTATAGTDYDTLSGVVTLPAGQASGFVRVDPIPDWITEGQETVIATLQQNQQWPYTVGSPASATVTISDRLLALDWLKVIDAVNEDNYALAEDAGIPELYVLELEGGSADVVLDAGIRPGTEEARQHVLWRVVGSSSSPASGDFSTPPTITLTPGDRVFTIEAGVDHNGDGYLQSGEVERAVEVTVVLVEQISEDAEVFLNSAWQIRIQVTPASAASHVRLMMEENTMAVFAEGGFLLDLSSGTEDVDVFGGNFFEPGEGIPGETPIFALIRTDQPPPVAARRQIGEVISACFSDLAAEATAVLPDQFEDWVTSGIRAWREQAINAQLEQWQNGTPEEQQKAADFITWRELIGDEQMRDADGVAARHVLGLAVSTNPADYEDARWTLNTTRLPGYVKGYSPSLTIADYNGSILGVSIEPQPVASILDRLLQDPLADFATNPQYLVREVSAGFGFRFDASHAFAIEAALRYADDNPVLAEPEVVGTLRYWAEDRRPDSTLVQTSLEFGLRAGHPSDPEAPALWVTIEKKW